jgi:integrase
MYGKALFRWLRDEGKTTRPDNPFQDVTVARLSSKQKRAPSAAEVEALMILPRPRGLDATAWRAMPLLGRYTGCRAGELAQLRAEDVIVEQGIRCLAIRGDGGERRLKTASSQRLVPVAAKINILLDELVAAHPSGPLLETGTFRGADGIVKGAHRFLQAFNRAAKRVAGDLSFHCLRVYANDAMATAGVDIGDRERLLGHKSERTQSAYTPENLRRLKAAVDTIP